MTVPATNLLLIRHGLTDYVTVHRMAGWRPGVHLNDQGRAQAAALARLLADVKLAAVYSSPLDRAVETATPLAGPRGLPVETRPGLGELHPGDWTGRTVQEMEKEDLWQLVQAHPSGVRLPGGESFLECQSRTVAELDRIRHAHPGGTVAVVFHADPIRMAVAYYLGLPLDLFRRLLISPASVTALAFHRLAPHLLCLNYTPTPVVQDPYQATPAHAGSQESVHAHSGAIGDDNPT